MPTNLMTRLQRLEGKRRPPPPPPKAGRLVRLSDLMIRTKDKRLVPFTPNAVQRAYLDVLCPQWQLGVIDLHGLRELLLKARQFGFSTLVLALLFLDTINHPATTTVIIAHDTESTERLFQIIQRFYENLTADLRPPTRYNTRRELTWPTLDSTVFIGTAGAKAFGRGSTINNLHASEVGFWKNGEELVTGLLQAVPADGCAFLESTANGAFGVLYEQYQQAKEGLSTFTPRFFAWFQHDEYRLPVPTGFTATEEEKGLAKAHGLTDQQLQWRRQKIKEPGMGSLFMQEYPANDTEAFRVSGSKYFTEWNESTHLVAPFDIPTHWRFFGGMDWGKFAPMAFLLAATDEDGKIHIVDEIYQPGLTDHEHADEILRLLERYKVDPARCPIYLDPSKFAPRDPARRIGEYSSNVYWGKKLRVQPAANERVAGWTRVKEFLTEGRLVVFKGRCPSLVKEIPLQVHDEHDPEDLDESRPEHAVDALRYLCMSWPSKSKLPPEERTGVRRYPVPLMGQEKEKQWKL